GVKRLRPVHRASKPTPRAIFASPRLPHQPTPSPLIDLPILLKRPSFLSRISSSSDFSGFLSVASIARTHGSARVVQPDDNRAQSPQFPGIFTRSHMKLLACGLAAATIFAFAVPAAAKDFPYKRNVTLSVGGSTVLKGVRSGDCSDNPPSWSKVS